MLESLRRTSLYDLHLELGAKMVPFAGWEMPVQYESLMSEHRAVRESCGVFDISHMGQFFLEGPQAISALNALLTNDLTNLAVGQGQYTLMLNEEGGVIDDMIVYRQAEEKIFLVVNASCIEIDYAWLSERLDGLKLVDESASWSGLAVQGPSSQDVFDKLGLVGDLPERNGVAEYEVGGEIVVICRTGYTGEDGFEFFCSNDTAQAWLRQILAAGATPCGLGARDSLRLEVGYPLNGSDLAADRTPLEAGLGFFVALEKGDFVGRDRLVQQKSKGLSQKLVAISYTGKGPPPRAHYPVCLPDGGVLGELSSGVLSPSLMTGIGMAYLPIEQAKVGTEVEIEVRGRRVPAQIVKKPFYKRP